MAQLLPSVGHYLDSCHTAASPTPENADSLALMFRDSLLGYITAPHVGKSFCNSSLILPRIVMPGHNLPNFVLLPRNVMPAQNSNLVILPRTRKPWI